MQLSKQIIGAFRFAGCSCWNIGSALPGGLLVEGCVAEGTLVSEIDSGADGNGARSPGRWGRLKLPRFTLVKVYFALSGRAGCPV